MYRNLARLSAGTLLAVAALAPTLSMADDGTTPRDDTPEALLDAAYEVLRLTDNDRSDALWDSASKVMKERVPRTIFIEQTRKWRQTIGTVTERDWTGVVRVRQAEGHWSLPAGRYANIGFATSLVSGQTATEKVSFVREQDQWRFTGYTVVPPDASAGSIPAPTPSAVSPVEVASLKVEAAVRDWAAAWSARDMKRYFAAYAPDFTPARHADRESWETERRARIAGRSRISVAIDQLAIQVRGQTASARFKQTYRGDGLETTDRKTLELQRVGERWLIRKESVGS